VVRVTGPRPGPRAGDRALAAAASLGPFFQVHRTVPAGAITWAQLCAGDHVLDRRVAEVRATLAAGPGAPAVEPMVAVSLAHFGLVARLVAPLLGAALLEGVLPVAPAERVHLRLSGANPLPLAVLGTTGVPVRTAADLADAMTRSWLRPVIDPLTAAVRASFALSADVLDGNVASAVAGALRMVAAARPVPRAAETLDAMLADGPLAGTGRRKPDGAFVRRSCCLFYRLPGAGTCLDCVLIGRDRRPRPGASPTL
jgi:hypothetical protein